MIEIKAENIRAIEHFTDSINPENKTEISRFSFQSSERLDFEKLTNKIRAKTLRLRVHCGDRHYDLRVKANKISLSGDYEVVTRDIRGLGKIAKWIIANGPFFNTNHFTADIKMYRVNNGQGFATYDLIYPKEKGRR